MFFDVKERIVKMSKKVIILQRKKFVSETRGKTYHFLNWVYKIILYLIHSNAFISEIRLCVQYFWDRKIKIKKLDILMILNFVLINQPGVQNVQLSAT